MITTLAEALERIAVLEARVIDSEEQVAYLMREFDKTLGVIARVGDYVGSRVSEPEPTGQLLAFPAGRKAITHKRVAGSAAAQVTALAAPRRASTSGRAS